MGASDFAKLPHIGESYLRKEDYRFLTGAGQYTDDIDLANKLKFNVMGNRHMLNALDVDTEHKIDTWCFGHYHGKVDQYRDSVRYVNNCRGRGQTPWSQYVYHPLRVVIDY